MKRISVFVVLVIGFFVSSYAAEINECKTDIYYGNGVWNSSENAENSKDDLEKRIIVGEIIKGNPTLQAKYGKVKLQYNWSFGKMNDLLETYYQLKHAGQLGNMGFFETMMILTTGNVGLSAKATKILLNSMPIAIQMTEENNVDTMWNKYYNQSFKLGHRVLLVSHSQGNLFANRVYDRINPSGYTKYFANVQVASPASSVHAVNGTYVTGLVDPVINPIPGSMSYNGVLALPGGHRFVEAYLDSPDTYDRIVTGIKAQLDNLDKTDSQWSTDQEYDKNTCDYKITVKHRFDQSMEMAEKVYPFNIAKKLYSVNGEYVKASCGGKNILSAWEGKKKNECWMIDNSQKEKIATDLVGRLYMRYYYLYSDYIYHSPVLTYSGYVDNAFKDTCGDYEYTIWGWRRGLGPLLDVAKAKYYLFHSVHTRALDCILKKFNKNYDDIVAIRIGEVRKKYYGDSEKVDVEYLIGFK